MVWGSIPHWNSEFFFIPRSWQEEKKIFLYFFTELKPYHLSYSFYKNDNDDYNDMIMLITMIMLTRTNDNGYDKDNYRDPWGQY